MTHRKATKEVMNNAAKNINGSFNDMQGTPYWKSTKRYIKAYLKQNDIKQISFIDFANLTGLNTENAKKMILEINTDLFNKTLK